MHEPIMLEGGNDSMGAVNGVTPLSLKEIEIQYYDTKGTDDPEFFDPILNQEPMATEYDTNVVAKAPLVEHPSNCNEMASDRRGSRLVRRMSTGSLLNSEIKDKTSDHTNLSATVASLLDSQVSIDNDSMEWRNAMLQAKEHQEKVIGLNDQQHFVHPLHCGEDPKQQRRRLSNRSDDDISVLSNDSVQSTWSMASAYQSWFGTKSHYRKRPLLSKLSSNRFSSQTKRHPSGRRFIDLTVNGGHDDCDDIDLYEIESEDNDEDADDDCSETATIYSIPIPNRSRRSQGSNDEPSMARKFLDLTDGIQDDLRHLDSFGNSKRFAFSWMGRSKAGNIGTIQQNSISSLNASMSTNLRLANNVQDHETNDNDNDDDDDDNDDGEDNHDEDDHDDDDKESISLNSEESEEHRATAAWEVADAALIESVHDITRNLERMLNEQGLESPFWSTEEIIPHFNGLHTKIKENMDRLKSKAAESSSQVPKPAPAPPPTITKTRGGKSKTSGSKARPLLRLLSGDYSEIAPRRTSLPPHDPIGGYDDLSMRTLQRDERAYLKTFFYDCRLDGSCSLPFVLASGLEKRLHSDTIDVALDLLETLTSPLRPCRESTTTIQEGENEEEEDETMQDHTTGSHRSHHGVTLDESLPSLGVLHFSVASLEPTSEVETKKRESIELTI